MNQKLQPQINKSEAEIPNAKIALFTDDDIGAEITAHLLEEHFELVHIRDSNHSMLKTDEFVLILCDEKHKDEIQNCSEVNHSIPVLFLSEKTDEEIHAIMDASERPFSFLKKPFYPDELLRYIHIALRK